MPAAGQDGAEDGRFDLAGMEVVLVLGQERILLDGGKPFDAESQHGQGDTQTAGLDPVRADEEIGGPLPVHQIHGPGVGVEATMKFI